MCQLDQALLQARPAQAPGSHQLVLALQWIAITCYFLCSGGLLFFKLLSRVWLLASSAAVVSCGFPFALGVGSVSNTLLSSTGFGLSSSATGIGFASSPSGFGSSVAPRGLHLALLQAHQVLDLVFHQPPWLQLFCFHTIIHCCVCNLLHCSGRKLAQPPQAEQFLAEAASFCYFFRQPCSISGLLCLPCAFLMDPGMAVFQATNPIEALKNGFGPSHKMEAEKSIGFASSHKSQITSSFEQNSCKQSMPPHIETTYKCNAFLTNQRSAIKQRLYSTPPYMFHYRTSGSIPSHIADQRSSRSHAQKALFLPFGDGLLGKKVSDQRQLPFLQIYAFAIQQSIAGAPAPWLAWLCSKPPLGLKPSFKASDQRQLRFLQIDSFATQQTQQSVVGEQKAAAL